MDTALARFLITLIIGISTTAGAQAQSASPPSAEELNRGEYLARVGDCVSCHSSAEGG